MLECDVGLTQDQDGWTAWEHDAGLQRWAGSAEGNLNGGDAPAATAAHNRWMFLIVLHREHVEHGGQG